MFANLTLGYSNIDFTPCFAYDCTAQSNADQTTATIHVINANNIMFNNIRVEHTGF